MNIAVKNVYHAKIAAFTPEPALDSLIDNMSNTELVNKCWKMIGEDTNVLPMIANNAMLIDNPAETTYVKIRSWIQLLDSIVVKVCKQVVSKQLTELSKNKDVKQRAARTLLELLIRNSDAYKRDRKITTEELLTLYNTAYNSKIKSSKQLLAKDLSVTDVVACDEDGCWRLI